MRRGRRRQPLRPQPQRRQRRQRRPRPHPVEARVGVARILGPGDALAPSSQSRSSARRTPSSGRSQRTPSADATAAIAASPSTPEPRASRIRKVSAWSSSVWPSATAPMPRPRAQSAISARRASPRPVLQVAAAVPAGPGRTSCGMPRAAQSARHRRGLGGALRPQPVVDGHRREPRPAAAAQRRSRSSSATESPPPDTATPTGPAGRRPAPHASAAAERPVALTGSAAPAAARRLARHLGARIAGVHLGQRQAGLLGLAELAQADRQPVERPRRAAAPAARR